MRIINKTQKLLKKIAFSLHNTKTTDTPAELREEPPHHPQHNESQNRMQQEISPASKPEELMAQAVAAFENRHISVCLARWEEVRKRFPDFSGGYIQGGFAALELGKVALAEELATQAMKKFPDNPDAFILSAEVAMSSHAFDLAISRWGLVRKHSPRELRGYIRAGLAFLELKQIPRAEEMATHAANISATAPELRQLQERITAAKQPVPAKPAPTFPDLLDIAEKDMDLGLYRQAYRHFKLATKYRTIQFPAFKGAIEAAMELRNYREAEATAKDMIARFPLNMSGYQYLVQSFEARKEWEKALSALEDIKKKFPQYPYGWQRSAEILLKAGNYERSDAEIKEAVRLFPKNLGLHLIFAQWPLHAPDPETRSSVMERCQTILKNFPQRYTTYLKCLNIYYRLTMLHNNKRHQEAYQHMLNIFEQHFNKTTNQSNNEKKKVAVYGEELKYIIPVIKCLPPDFIDIIFPRKTFQKFISQFGLEKYNIVYGYENLENYDYLIMDTNTFFRNPKLKELNCKLIGYPHASDATMPGKFLNLLSLALFESQRQMITPMIIPCDPLRNWTPLPDAEYKCELCYTGPYHLGNYLERRLETKSDIKAEVAETLGIHIPQDKPLVFILQDEYCNLKQLAYAANRMAEYATVIFKTLAPITEPYLEKFKSSVHMLRGNFTPNLLRFAADFICCGYLSGSFTTSVMLGQNVLPYYSRIVYARNMVFPYMHIKRYDDFLDIPEPAFRTAKHVLYLKFYNEGKLQSLTDAASFKKAILGTEYKDWYQSILPSLQKEAFGEYILAGAPQKMADYIMRFVNEGTLGKDCAAVYFKEKYFA